MPYVDGFVVAVPKRNIAAYKDMARGAGEVWKEHGALAFVECIGDDVPHGELTSFPRAVQAKDDEVVVLSWIVHESRERRDATNAKAMADPRVREAMSNMPFDGKRMIFGGFETPCCTDRPAGRLGVGWRGGEPSKVQGSTRRAVQGQRRPPAPHPQAAAPGHELGRVRRRPARPRQPDRVVLRRSGRRVEG